jgi:WD40 repeat protein
MYALCMGDGSVMLVSALTLKILQVTNGLKYRENNLSNTLGKTLVVEPRNGYVVLPGGVPGSIQFYNLKTDQRIAELEVVHQNRISRLDDEQHIYSEVEMVAFSTSGKWMATVIPFIQLARQNRAKHSKNKTRPSQSLISLLPSAPPLPSHHVSASPHRQSKVDRRQATQTSPEELALKFWIFNASSQQYEINTRVEAPHKKAISTLLFQPNKESVAVTVSYDGRFKIWTSQDKSQQKEAERRNPPFFSQNKIKNIT